jgi:mRNA interferase RelE/StbE
MSPAYGVRVLRAASDDVGRLDRETAQRVVDRIRWLAANIEELRPEPLTGSLAGLYKLRAGDYRILYELLREERTIVVHAIGHRRDIYRRR